MSIFEKLRDEREEKRRKHIETLEDRVLLAESVRRFFEGEVGLHVKSKIASDCDSLLKEIAKQNAFKPKKILELQSQYHALKRLETYFGMALIEGDNAYQELQQSNNRD